jgi:hypothetical protein
VLRVGDLVKTPDEDSDGEVLGCGLVVEAENEREAYHQHVRVLWGQDCGTLWHLGRNLEVVNEGR